MIHLEDLKYAVKFPSKYIHQKMVRKKKIQTST